MAPPPEVLSPNCTESGVGDDSGFTVWLGWRQVTEGLGVLFELQLLFKDRCFRILHQESDPGKAISKRIVQHALD